jgi:peptidoglycan/xylan/chitin deacetylase (PgdA/CDA1 family)
VVRVTAEERLDRDARGGMSRRAFLAGAAVAVVAAACGDGGTSGSLSAPTQGLGATTTTVPTATTVAPTTSAPPGGPAQFVSTGATAQARLALTFHTNGDLAQAQQLLDALAARRVPITAFVVGDWLDANPTWAKKLVDAGHELANHTYTHPTFESLSPTAMLGEITRCRDAIARLTGTGGAFFRPSGTDDGKAAPSAACLAAAGTAGYRTVLGFDVDPFDYQDPGAAAVAQRTLATAKAGSIVSLHFGHPGTIAAIPAILDGITSRGLTPVTASRLLA